MKNIVKLLLLLLFATFLSSCGTAEPYVKKKTHIPESYSWEENHQTCFNTEVDRQCIGGGDFMQFYPEVYRLYIVDGDNQGWINVDEAAYDYYNVGDTYLGLIEEELAYE